MSKISITILRKVTDQFPKRETCSLGDMVVMTSGDIMVWTGNSWDLLPGRYLSVEELKTFISYVASGWPDNSDIANQDLFTKMPNMFLSRMLDLVDKISENSIKLFKLSVEV